MTEKKKLIYWVKQFRQLDTEGKDKYLYFTRLLAGISYRFLKQLETNTRTPQQEG
jgi:hypothetical protein